MTIDRKMLLLGGIIIGALVLLLAQNFYQSSSITKHAELKEKAVAQLESVMLIKAAYYELMASAKSAVADKSGAVSPERLKIINKNTVLLTTKSKILASLVDNPEGRQLASSLSNSVKKISVSIKDDLVQLVSSGPEESEIASFLNDLDRLAISIEENINKLFTMTSQARDRENTSSAQALKRGKMITLGVFAGMLFLIGISFGVITKTILGPLTDIVQKLQSGAELLSKSSNQISSASQSLADGASQQAASLEETSATLEEMTSMTKGNADNASEANNLMQETNQVVSQANNSMIDLTASMEAISDASQDTQKIVKTIDEIAFQTNLLALNAAVEAARAGEAGAGFAVVADEVRNLAMRAAEAAKNTGGLIESTITKVEEGYSLVKRTNEAFGDVAENSANVGTLVSEIAVASKEQSGGISQISHAVTDMDQITQRNAATAEESASSSEEMKARGDNLLQIVKTLKLMITGEGGGVGVSGAASMTGNFAAQQAAAPRSAGRPTPALPAARPSRPPKSATPARNMLKPEEAIPFDDDDDFEDF